MVNPSEWVQGLLRYTSITAEFKGPFNKIKFARTVIDLCWCEIGHSHLQIQMGPFWECCFGIGCFPMHHIFSKRFKAYITISFFFALRASFYELQVQVLLLFNQTTQWVTVRAPARLFTLPHLSVGSNALMPFQVDQVRNAVH